MLEDILITGSHPATEKTRPWEESICIHCGKPIWRMTDGHGHGWMHKDQLPNFECQYPRTHAEPKLRTGEKILDPRP